MSRAVEFDDVRRRLAEFGELATLVTVNERGAPHAVSVVVAAADGRLVAAVGSRTLANIAGQPAVSLLWMPASSGDYQLILDGTAAPLDTSRTDGITDVSVTVTTGILHRLAGRRSAGPTCVALGAARGPTSIDDRQSVR